MKLKLFIFLLVFALFSCEKETPTPHKKDPSTHEQGKESNDTTKVNPSKPTTEPTTPTTEKPDEYFMGKRAVAHWKVEANVYYDGLDIDKLELEPQSITAEMLKNFVVFHSSQPDGTKQYDFTDEDLKNVQITDLHYDNKYITFRVVYKNIKSDYSSTLPFIANEYYAHQFKINQDFVSQSYMEGIYQNPETFLGNLLIFDHEHYMPEGNISKGKNAHTDALTISFDVYDQKRHTIVGRITKDFSGFKPLKTLAQSLVITPTNDLVTDVKNTIKRIWDKPNLKQRLNNVFINQKWMQKTNISVDDIRLAYYSDVVGEYNIRGDVMQGRGKRLDVYLFNPRWRIVEFTQEQHNLKLKIKLEMVNNIVLENVFYTLTIPNVFD